MTNNCGALLLFIAFTFLQVPLYAQIALPEARQPHSQTTVNILPHVEPTVLTIPFSVSLAPFVSQVDSQIPKGDDGSGAWGVIDTDFIGAVGEKHKVWRDPVSVSFDGGQLVVRVHLYYWAAVAQRHRNGIFFGGYSWAQIGSCGQGEPAREALVTLRNTLWWTQDWHIGGRLSGDIKYLNSCSATVFKVNVNSLVNNQIAPKVRAAAQHLQDQINAANLKPGAAAAWSQLQSPAPISGSDLNLFLRPIAVAAGPISGSGQTLISSLEIHALPIFLPRTIANPPFGSVSQLPALFVSTAAPGFNINANATMPFSKATEVARTRLVGKAFTLNGLSLTITDAAVSGFAGDAFLKLTFAGGVTGSVFLRGTPGYDPGSDIFYISNIDLAPETANSLASDVVNALRTPDFLSTLDAAARWPLAGEIAHMKVQANQALNSQLPSGWKLSGAVDQVRTIQIIALPDNSAEILGLPNEAIQEGVNKNVFIITAMIQGHVSAAHQ